MPHRDPETGQFLSSDHFGAFADADDVLVIRGTKSWDAGATNDQNEEETLQEITFQKDYQILAVEADVATFPEQIGNASNASTADGDTGVLRYELATTAGMVEETAPGDGGELPAGVLDLETTRGHPGMLVENTEGKGGWGPQSDYRHDLIPAEHIFNADVTPDAGTSMAIHTRILDLPGVGELSTNVEYRLWVAEREDN